MPPKPKKKSVKDLENDLVALQLDKHQSETTLLDTNRRLASELSSYKALLVSLQREKDITHDVKEKELKQELIELRSKVSRLELLSANAARDAAQVDSLTNERMILLKQQQDMIAERVEAGKIYAKDTADLKAQLSTLKYRLESTFADTLKTAVVEEKRRLHLALDAEAQSALADVGALRIQNAAQARQIAQLVRVAEDRLREADACAAEARAADERAIHSELKLVQQAPHAQHSLRKINLEMEALKVDRAELEMKVKAANEKINFLVAGATSAHHLSSSRNALSSNDPPQLVTRLLQSNLQHGRMRPNSASSFIGKTVSSSNNNEEDAESDLLNAMIGSGSYSYSSGQLGGQEKNGLGQGQGQFISRQRPQSAHVFKSSPLSQLPPIAEDWSGGNSILKSDKEKRRPISAASIGRPSSASSSVSINGGSSRPSSGKTFGFGIVVSPLR